MKADLKKRTQDLRNWLNRTEKATGLKKSIIVTGILMSYALKSNELDNSSHTRKTSVKSAKYPKKGNI